MSAIAVALKEAGTADFRAYGHQIVKNAAALADALAAEGFRIVSGGTDNHLMLVDLRSFDAELTGKEAQLVLDEAGITLNKNTIPNDPRSPFHNAELLERGIGIRFRSGSAAGFEVGACSRDFGRGRALLFHGSRNRHGNLRHFGDRAGNLLDRCHSLLGRLLHGADLQRNLFRCLRSLAGEILHLRCDNGKSLACFARARSLDSGIEGEEICLRCNAANEITDLTDLVDRRG